MSLADKLNYLKGTKDLMKTGLNTMGAGITNDTFRSYKDKIQYVYDNWPRVTGEGTDLALSPTIKAPMSVGYKGDTYQAAGSKNMLPDDWEVGGISYSTGENETANANRTVGYIEVEPSTTYTLSRSIIGGSLALRHYGTSKNYLGMIADATGLNYNEYSKSFTTPSDGHYLRLVDGVQNSDNQMQLEKGSTATAYEPYREGSAPTPTTPVPINVVSGRQDVIVEGENILPQNKYIATQTINGIAYTNNGDGTFNLVGTASANTTIQIIPIGNINLEASQPYYLYSSQAYNGTTFNLSIPMTDNGTKFLLANGTYTPTSTPTNVRLQFYIASGQSVNATNIKLMLVKGNTAPTEYEAYNGNPYEVNLGKNLFKNVPSSASNTYLTMTNDGNKIHITGASDSGHYPSIIFYADGSVKTSIWYGAVGDLNSSKGYFIQNDGIYTLSVKTNNDTKYTITLGRATDVQHILTYNSGNRNATITNQKINFIGIGFAPNSGEIDIELELQLEKGTVATTYAPYKTPIELCKIGNYQDRIYKNSGKNLFDVSTITPKKYIGRNNGNVGSSNDWSATDFIPVKPNTTYILSGITNSWSSVAGSAYYDKDKNYISGESSLTYTFNTSANCYYIRISLNSETPTNVMFNEGSTALPYEPYGSGTWYLTKEIGKVDLSTLTWTNATTYAYSRQLTDIKYVSSNQQVGTGLAESYQLRKGSGMSSTDWVGYMAIDTAQITINPNNVTQPAKGMFYYALKTPTTTGITDTELISQLESIKMSNEDVTHLKSTGILPVILDANVLKKKVVS